MERPSWAPEDVDIGRPSAARVYDCLLGGSHNFAVDREVARRILAVVPNAAITAQENRSLLGRVVRFLAHHGVRQFVNLGSGIATLGSAHEVAHRIDPRTRVVYVDNDPVAVAHSRAILADIPQTGVVAGDLRRPVDVLADPELLRIIDLDQPVGVLLVSVLHFVPDEEHPADIVAGYVNAVVPGSYLGLSHVTVESLPDRSAEAISLYNKAVDVVYPRTRKEITALFGDLTLVEPGVEYAEPSCPESVYTTPGTRAGR